MKKTLVKSKIVLEDDGTGLVLYFWKKTFWIFGYWYIFGSTSSLTKIQESRISSINDARISKVLFKEIRYNV